VLRTETTLENILVWLELGQANPEFQLLTGDETEAAIIFYLFLSALPILLKFPFICFLGRAIAEAVSVLLLTSASRVRARVWQVGFGMDKVASGQIFSEFFGFPCPNSSFYQLLHHHNHPGQTRRGLATS
jgi:hypothetical protein